MCPAPAKSALFPGQAVVTPAGNGIALMMIVQFAFKAVQHVIDLGEAGFLQRGARVQRAVAAAADKYQRPVHARRFLHVADEMRIYLPVRPVVPGDHDRARRMPDKQEFHLAAAIDEYRAWVLVKEIVGFLWGQVLHRPASARKSVV